MLFDPGLQPERTELAWRRTALALGVGSLVAVRLLPAVFEQPAWVFVGIVGLIVAAVLWFAARQRYRVVTEVLMHDGDRAVLPGAALIVALVAVVFVSGLAALVVVLLAPMRELT